MGKACERVAVNSGEFELAGVFSRRRGLTSPYGTQFFRQEEILDATGDVDVAVLCTGSANDLVGLGLSLAGKINTADSFDTHAKMAEYVQKMDAAAREGGTLSMVGIGWDPGIFSLCRAMFEAVLRDGRTNTFWGRGVSQGHSEALRRIDGVADAVQYTVPKQSAMQCAREGEGRRLLERDMHLRVCYVVAEAGADRQRIEREIREMPNYFAPYDVEIHFVDAETLRRDHSGMPHGGRVMRTGRTAGGTVRLELGLETESNPDFTAGILMRYASACVSLFDRGERGARTVLDVPIGALYENPQNVLRFV